jgi:hypothetical protein
MKKEITLEDRQKWGRKGGLKGKGVSRMTSEQARERANISWKARKARQEELERKAEMYDELVNDIKSDEAQDILAEQLEHQDD